MKNDCVWSVEYEFLGNLYVMHILGTWEEAIQHADSLGLSNPEKVVALIPDMTGGIN